MVEVELLLLMGLIVVIAYFVKGALGFGEGLITISFFLLFLDLKLVLPLALLLALVGGFYQVFHFKTDIIKNIVFVFIVPIIIGVIIGTYLLNQLDSEVIKTIFAIAIILYSLKLLFFSEFSKSEKQINKPLAGIVGFIGGLVDGLIGLGGVPIIVYLNHIKLKKAAFRATCVLTFIVLATTRTITYAYSGLISVDTIKMALYLAPAILIGSLGGIRIHSKINEDMFTRIVTVMLLIIGIINIF